MSSKNATHRDRESSFFSPWNNLSDYSYSRPRTCDTRLPLDVHSFPEQWVFTSYPNKDRRGQGLVSDQMNTLDKLFDQIFDFNHFPLNMQRSYVSSSVPTVPPGKNPNPSKTIFDLCPCKQEYNFVEKNGQYECEIPIGHDMIDNLQIKEKNRFIELNATKKVTEKKKDDNNEYFFKSSTSNSWYQSLLLPKNAVDNSTIASYQDGKLKLIAQIDHSI